MMRFDEHGLVDLASLGLTAEQHAARRGFVNASEIPDILYGDVEDRERIARYHLFGEIEDLSDDLPVVMGSYTEHLNLAWLSKRTGWPVSRQHISRTSDRAPWLRATLDGWLPDLGIHVEAKHTNAYMTAEQVIAWYTGQLQAQMFVFGTTRALLSVLYGNLKWDLHEVGFDAFWWEEAEELLRVWHQDIKDGRMPEAAIVAPAMSTPPRTAVRIDLSALREVDMAESNSWAEHAGTFLATAEAAKQFEHAKDELKALMPTDARRAHGHGVEIKRATNARLTVSAIPAEPRKTSEYPSNPRRRRRVAEAV
jgi:hypothetical protein